MRIGISYNIKGDIAGPGLPEDAYEEFDAPETIFAIRDVLSGLGHDVLMLGFGRDAVGQVLNNKIDFVFNIAEGYLGRSREAQIPALLEMLGIPYSGPDPLAAALTLDKSLAKKVAAASGINTPAYFMFYPGRDFNYGMIDFPVILKPVWEGSSKGIRNSSLVNNREELNNQLEWLGKNYPGGPVIAEEFIGGREFTVGIIGNNRPEVIGIMEVIPKNKAAGEFVYSLEVKRDYLAQVDYCCPARIDPILEKRIKRSALSLYEIFGCRDISRFDFRVDKDGTPSFLEVNPLPGLNPVSSDLVIMAKLLGIKYDNLITSIFHSALERCNLKYAKV